MRVLVCGGRDFQDRKHLDATLSAVHAETPISCIVHGAAVGADTMAGEWAAKAAIPVDSFPADWSKHGRAAGPIRNKRMIDEGKPDLVVAYPGGRGTANMVKQARAAGIRVQVIDAPV